MPRFTQGIGGRYLMYLNGSDVVEDLVDRRVTISSRPLPNPNLFGSIGLEWFLAGNQVP